MVSILKAREEDRREKKTKELLCANQASAERSDRR